MNKTFKKTFDFGKVDYNHTGIKRNQVNIDMELKVEDGKVVFTASGEVWNHVKTDIFMGGQCIVDIWEDFSKDIKNPSLYKEIMSLWKKWHLNDLHAECEHQEKKGMTWAKNPSNVCKICKWKLGHGWSYRRIDKKDLLRITSLLDIDTFEKIKLVRSVTV